MSKSFPEFCELLQKIVRTSNLYFIGWKYVWQPRTCDWCLQWEMVLQDLWGLKQLQVVSYITELQDTPMSGELDD